MKKLILFLMALALSSPVFANVGLRVNGVPYPAVTDLNFVCGSGANSSPISNGIASVNCSPNLATSGVANGGATSIASTVNAIPVSFSYVRVVADSDGNSAFTAKTLANGTPGQMMTVYVAGISPSGATTGANYTITPATSTGFSSIKLSAINDHVVLFYIDDNFGWVIAAWSNAASNSVTINLKP